MRNFAIKRVQTKAAAFSMPSVSKIDVVNEE